MLGWKLGKNLLKGCKSWEDFKKRFMFVFIIRLDIIENVCFVLFIFVFFLISIVINI